MMLRVNAKLKQTNRLKQREREINTQKGKRQYNSEEKKRKRERV